MADYDYGNARLHAMKSRLLSRRELESLAETGNLQSLIAELTQTAYRKAVESALARTSGMDCIALALRNDLVSTLGKIRGFYRARAGERVAIVMQIYDVQNLKAILRGVAKQVPPAEIGLSALPVGELTDTILAELARAPGPRVVIDLLATLGSPLSQPLLTLRAESAGARVPEMEIALDRWYFQKSFLILRRNPRASRVLLSALRLEADIINLLTALRFAHAPGERKFLQEWVKKDDLSVLFVGPGHIPVPLLVRAGGQDTVQAAIEALESTSYAHSLQAGLEAYSQSALLSDIEKHIKRFQLQRLSALIPKDPLGIGVLLGYLALKTNEVSNLRWIAQGVNLKLSRGAIQALLEIPG